MKMRPSRVLAKLRAGEVVNCIKLNLADPRVAEIAGACGFDCIWNDLEHVANDLDAIANQIRAAKMFDVDTVVRVPRGSYSDLIRPLEMDATGIMVPHVMSAADAREVARQTKFHPIGRRPIDGGNSDGSYCMIPVREYIEQANRERFVIVQIEDPEPMDELEAIAQVAGVDMLFFGPGDFSHGIGDPGNLHHPRVEDARRRVAEVACRYGKFAGTVGSLEAMPALIEMGYRFLNVGADVVALADAFRGIAAGLATSAAVKRNSFRSSSR